MQYHSQAGNANEQALLALPLMCDRADHADRCVYPHPLPMHAPQCNAMHCNAMLQ